MGCVVNGPGESKHANIGISLPGTFEEPVAPVFVDGALRTTLRGEGLVDEFITILDDYVERRYGRRPPQRCDVTSSRSRRAQPWHRRCPTTDGCPGIAADASRPFRDRVDGSSHRPAHGGRRRGHHRHPGRRRAARPADPGQPRVRGREPDAAGPDGACRRDRGAPGPAGRPAARSPSSSSPTSGPAPRRASTSSTAACRASIGRSAPSTQDYDVSTLVVDPTDVSSLPATSTFFPETGSTASMSPSRPAGRTRSRPSCS